jgi:hypothetical protein
MIKNLFYSFDIILKKDGRLREEDKEAELETGSR